MIETLLYWITFPLIWLYSRLMLRVDIEWQQKLPRGPKIIAANHPSTSDPFLIAALAKRPSRILIIEHIFKIPVVGTYLRRSGHIPVIRDRGKEAFESARKMLENGQTVIIFPEGLISPAEGGFHNPRTGVARLALLTGASVIPVGIHLDRDRLQMLNSNIEGNDEMGSWYFQGPYHMTVGNVLRFEGDVDDRQLVHNIASTIMDDIISLAQQSELRSQPIFARNLHHALD